MENKLNLALNIVLIFLILVAIFRPIDYSKVTNKPQYERYCIEWIRSDGSVLMAGELMSSCYNFAKQEITCDYFLSDQDQLKLHEYGHKDLVLETLQCNKYALVESTEV
jgi:hypothetical protein